MHIFPFYSKKFYVNSNPNLSFILGSSISSANFYNSNFHFSGNVWDSSFKIWHTVSRRNSFNPVIEGKYISSHEFSIEVRISCFSKIALAINMAIMLSILLILIFSNTALATIAKTLLFFVLYTVYLYLLILLGYYIDNKRRLNDLYKYIINPILLSANKNTCDFQQSSNDHSEIFPI